MDFKAVYHIELMSLFSSFLHKNSLSILSIKECCIHVFFVERVLVIKAWSINVQSIVDLFFWQPNWLSINILDLTRLVTRSVEYILDMILFKVIPLKYVASCLPPLNIGTIIPSVQLLGYNYITCVDISIIQFSYER